MNSLNTPVSAALPIAIVRTHPHHCRQSAATITLLTHVANQPDGCTFDELLPVYRAAKANERPEYATPENLQNLLYKLAEKNHLFSEGRGQSCVWHLGAEARTLRDGPALTTGAYAGRRTPPPQYDLQRAPVYVPPRSPVPRAGSLDFQRVASHGYGC